MLIDFNDNSKIYEETFDPIYNQFNIDDLKPEKILSGVYENKKLIEKTFKFEDKTYYYYFYFSGTWINLILVSRNRIDNAYYEFIKHTSDKLFANYKKIKAGELNLKKFFDENMFINFSRSYTTISLLQNELIEEIFQDPKERDLVRKELIQLPVETFSEFIKLHEQHIKELELEKLKDAIKNIDYFHEGGFK
jgi:hypothetical protein